MLSIIQERKRIDVHVVDLHQVNKSAYTIWKNTGDDVAAEAAHKNTIHIYAITE